VIVQSTTEPGLSATNHRRCQLLDSKLIAYRRNVDQRARQFSVITTRKLSRHTGTTTAAERFPLLRFSQPETAIRHFRRNATVRNASNAGCAKIPNMDFNQGSKMMFSKNHIFRYFDPKYITYFRYFKSKFLPFCETMAPKFYFTTSNDRDGTKPNAPAAYFWRRHANNLIFTLVFSCEL